MTAFVDLQCRTCGRRYGGLLRDGEEAPTCPRCGEVKKPAASIEVVHAGSMVMGFGRYRNRILKDILQDDVEYFEWLATRCEFLWTNRSLANAVELLWKTHQRETAPKNMA